MKIGELPRWEEDTETGMTEVAGGEYVLFADLPPKRDAKKDPPENNRDVWSYSRGFSRPVIGFRCSDGRWFDTHAREILCDEWSEIIHW